MFAEAWRVEQLNAGQDSQSGVIGTGSGRTNRNYRRTKRRRCLGGWCSVSKGMEALLMVCSEDLGGLRARGHGSDWRKRSPEVGIRLIMKNLTLLFLLYSVRSLDH